MISLSSVIKAYNGVKAVDGVSLEIGKGEFLALLGPNGAGKTSIVSMLLGLTRPTSGRVAINGLPAGTPASRRNLGYLAEQHKIPPHLTGWQFLARHYRLADLPGKNREGELARVLELTGMSGKERQHAGSYSKGMGQRLGLAAALLGNPRVLILDEPISGLDPLGIRRVREILESLTRRGCTILLNSHLLSEAEKTCTTAVILNKGRILAKGPVSKLVREGESLEDLFVRLIGDDHE